MSMDEHLYSDYDANQFYSQNTLARQFPPTQNCLALEPYHKLVHSENLPGVHSKNRYPQNYSSQGLSLGQERYWSGGKKGAPNGQPTKQNTEYEKYDCPIRGDGQTCRKQIQKRPPTIGKSNKSGHDSWQRTPPQPAVSDALSPSIPPSKKMGNSSSMRNHRAGRSGQQTRVDLPMEGENRRSSVNPIPQELWHGTAPGSIGRINRNRQNSIPVIGIDMVSRRPPGASMQDVESEQPVGCDQSCPGTTRKPNVQPVNLTSCSPSAHQQLCSMTCTRPHCRRKCSNTPPKMDSWSSSMVYKQSGWSSVENGNHMPQQPQVPSHSHGKFSACKIARDTSLLNGEISQQKCPDNQDRNQYQSAKITDHGYKSSIAERGTVYQNTPVMASEIVKLHKSSKNPSRYFSPHPSPVRVGLIPNSVASQSNNTPQFIQNSDNTQSTICGPSLVNLEIEQLKSIIKSKPNNQAAQLDLAHKWIQAAEVLTTKLQPIDRNEARKKYFADAHDLLTKLIANHSTDAMLFLADCYRRGVFDHEPDNKKAFSLYQSAAKAGHAGAAYYTALCCELGGSEGGGIVRDPLKALHWYHHAAALGYPPAMYQMGMIKLHGLLGQREKPKEALAWLKRAAACADAENPYALHELGLLYESRQPPGSIIRDEEHALSLFRQAAEFGDKRSQFRLGSAYEYGLLGLPIDARQSIMWYSRGAHQCEHRSELALSGWYLTGSEGVLQQCDFEAFMWARRAAIAGLARAEYAMGCFTELGIGCQADLEEAQRWYCRAAAQRFPKALEQLGILRKRNKEGKLDTRRRVSRPKVGGMNKAQCGIM